MCGNSCAARGAATGGAEPEGAEPGGSESEGAGSGGAAPGGAEPGGVEPGGAEPEGVEPGGAESEGAESGGAEPRGIASTGAPGAGDLAAGDTGAGGARVTARAGGIGSAGVTAAAAGSGGARTRGTGAAGSGGDGGAGARDPIEPGAAESGGDGAGGPSAGGAGARGAGAGGAGGGGAGARGTGVGGAGARGAGAVHPGAGGAGAGGTGAGGTPASALPAPSPYSEQTGGLTKRPEPAYRLASPVRTGRRVPRPRPPPVLGTHAMTLCPSSVPLRVPLPTPPASSLPAVPDLQSDRARAANPTVSRLLATVVTDPSFESTAASALVAELVDLAVASCLDYATTLVAESESTSPPSNGGECALGTDVLEDRQEDFECLAVAVSCFASMMLAPEGDSDATDIPTPRSYAEAIRGPYFSQWQAAMDAEMASWKSTSTYVDAVPPSWANIGVDYFQTFSPTPKMTNLWAPREWHDMLRTTLMALGFAPSTADLSLFLRIDTSLPPFYVLVYVYDLVLQRFGFQFSLPQPTPLSIGHWLSAPPSDESVPRACGLPHVHWDAAKRVQRYLCNTSGLGLMLGGRGPVFLTGRADASWVDDSATQWSSQGYTFSLGFGSVSWRSTRSSLVLRSSCEAEIYAGAMAAQELPWLTDLLTDLGEQPRLPPIMYVDNKAMIALCQEHRLEHRMKHIALRYFLAREMQQGGQLRLAYVATRANTADIFTKALPPGDHQRFSTVLGIVPTLHHYHCVSLFVL
ncbi:unnamed protein product [Closterium sp. NIES-54]